MKFFPAFLTVIGCSTLSAFCWDYTGNYNNTPPEDSFEVQYPAIIETVKVGGFALQLDRQEMGYRIYPSTSRLLADFYGDRFNLQVKRIPQGGSLEALAMAMNAGNDHVTLTPVKIHGIAGLRAEYGGKPNFFSRNIHAVRYFLTNPAGETICFDATATAPHADWSIVKHFVGDTIRPAQA